jgi:PAS domain S-box-containing protein
VAYEIPSLIDRHGRRDTVYWDFVYQPLREPDGRVTGVTVLATEVSERVAARLHLAAQQQLQAVFELAPVAIGVCSGPDYVVDVCNPSLQALWGPTAEEALNRPLFEVLPKFRDQGFKELLDEVVRTGVPHQAHEIPLQVMHNGRPATVHVNFVYQPLRDAQGHISAITLVATDVTEQVAARRLVQQLNEANVQRLDEELAVSIEELRSANQELMDSNQLLVRTNADLDNFIYTASHDLKSPIANIEGLLSALLMELPTETRLAGPVQPLLAMMQRAIERFQLTIVQLTDISKLQLAHAPVPEQVNLAALVEHVRLDLAPVLAAAGAHLTVNVQACPTVSFSPKNLRSIVYNLLSNAVKYHDPARGAVVQLRCHRHGTTVVLEVQDNGLGLNPDQQSRLFGMFQRLHDHVEGSGIGLYMVKKMVENAGGTIAVQSQPGVGSTFVVSFPG